MEKEREELETRMHREEQLAYAKRVSKLLIQEGIDQPKAFVHTYGCQQNVSDSETIKGFLIYMGCSMTEQPNDADIIVFNTCAVREHAETKVFGNVGMLKKLKKEKPNLIIALCGCMVQQPHIAEKIKKSYPYVDIVFGTHVRFRFPEFVYKRLTQKKRVFNISDKKNLIIEGLPSYRDNKNPFKAWLSIMHGCNNFCTYCIVPYVRGREISREPQEILKEAKQLVDSGVKEITLLGQNVNSYGKGQNHGVNFAKLLSMINDIEGDFRIRFMTSHPKDCTIELIDTISRCEKVCNHLHLPVQCGCDEVLKKMNRHYDKQYYLKLIEEARKRVPDIQFTSDIIVGFPGENYEQFKETLEFIEKVRYYSLFTFIYSPRKGTPAAKMQDNVSAKEKSEWFAKLLRCQEKISDQLNRQLVGKTVKVLCEGPGRIEGMISGRSSENVVVDFVDPGDSIGEFKMVKITSFDGVLKGIIL